MLYARGLSTSGNIMFYAGRMNSPREFMQKIQYTRRE